jgi:hypothetical protein
MSDLTRKLEGKSYIRIFRTRLGLASALLRQPQNLLGQTVGRLLEGIFTWSLLAEASNPRRLGDMQHASAAREWNASGGAKKYENGHQERIGADEAH